MIHFVTVNYESAGLIVDLLHSIHAEWSGKFEPQPWAYQVWIVNNSPQDQAVRSLTAPHVAILEAGQNVGFGAGCNLALAKIYPRDPQGVVWLINPDARLSSGAMTALHQVCHNWPQVSIMGTLVREPNGQLWFAGGKFEPNNGRIVAQINQPTPGELSATTLLPTDWVTGCSLVLQLSNFAQCPSFDPAFFLYYEDFDFCRRYLQQGHAIALAPQVCVIHQPSSIAGRNPTAKLRTSTYSYLLALHKHTTAAVVVYRLGRIVGHAARVAIAQPAQAGAIMQGVADYLTRRLTGSTPHAGD
jgi:N-acetylglucosaminyl-diphospho-decaprenol L-rhamnosyltransferase